MEKKLGKIKSIVELEQELKYCKNKLLQLDSCIEKLIDMKQERVHYIKNLETAILVRSGNK